MKRVLTAAVLAPVVLFIVIWGNPTAFFLLVAAVASLCYFEFGAMAHAGRPEVVAGLVVGTLILYLRPDAALLTLILFPLVVAALAMRFEKLDMVLPVAAWQTFGLLYIYGAWKTAFLLRAISPYWLTFALVVNWIGDTGAYYAGRRFGKHRLAPRVSPGKTWEGAIASVVVSVLFGVIFLTRLIPSVAIWQAMVVSIAANVAGQIGDLTESAIKRGAGVKDSGSLLPGHGGMLDRVDSQLFSLPVVYLIVGSELFISAGAKIFP